MPIVAVSEKPVSQPAQNLLGGLVFSWFEDPSPPQPQAAQVWINGVFVAPEYRRAGVAHALVDAAWDTAYAADIARLNVRTQYPGLYERLGWQPVRRENEQYYLIKERV